MYVWLWTKSRIDACPKDPIIMIVSRFVILIVIL